MVSLILVCSAAFGAVIIFRAWRQDLDEPERLSHLAWTAGLGAVGMVVAFSSSFALIRALGLDRPDSHVWLNAGRLGVLAATCEALARVAVVLVVWRCFKGAISEPIDGIIYGVAAGVGAAITEVAIDHLFIKATAIGHEPWLVAIFRNVGHTVLGGIACMGFGYLAAGRPGARRVLAAGLAVSWVLHATFDTIAYRVDDLKQVRVPLSHGVSAGAIIVGGAFILAYCLRAAQRTIGRVEGPRTSANPGNPAAGTGV